MCADPRTIVKIVSTKSLKRYDKKIGRCVITKNYVHTVAPWKDEAEVEDEECEGFEFWSAKEYDEPFEDRPTMHNGKKMLPIPPLRSV
jgi:hypothetical protein